MSTLLPEHTDEAVAALRRGLDLDTLTNPAGALFPDAFWEHEITMTGGGGPVYTQPHTALTNAWYPECTSTCCMI
jgi:hypothetical protein